MEIVSIKSTLAQSSSLIISSSSLKWGRHNIVSFYSHSAVISAYSCHLSHNPIFIFIIIYSTWLSTLFITWAYHANLLLLYLFCHNIHISVACTLLSSVALIAELLWSIQYETGLKGNSHSKNLSTYLIIFWYLNLTILYYVNWPSDDCLVDFSLYR